MAELSRYLQTMPPEPHMRSPRALRPVLALRLSLGLGGALIAILIAPSVSAASPATYDGISADGSVSIFSTDEALVPGDTDRERDVYERSYDEALERYVTREVSIGPTGGNDALPAQYDAVSADGSEVFFETREALVESDQDHGYDVYMRDLSDDTTTLVSRGAASCAEHGCGNGEFDAGFAPGGLTPDGERLFFVTDERLSSADQDSSPDIYMRNLGTSETILVSRGSPACESLGCGNGAFGVSLSGVSANGSTVVFSTYESLVEEDQDESQDVYARDLGTETTRLVSTPGACVGVVDCKAVYGGVAANGSHVFFESSEQITNADQDESQDVYDWTPGGGAALASTGPGGGSGSFNATYAGSSADGSIAYFETSESLVGADTDEMRDVYARSGGVTSLVSTGPAGGNGPDPAALRWVSPDGSSPAVFFTTTEPFTSEDEDASQDIYERSGGVTTLLSTGPVGGNGEFDASFAGASGNGTHVFFITAEPLVEEDEDSSSDIYETSEGITSLISTGPEGGNGTFGSGLVGVSEDGSRAFFTTEERLTEGDPDSEVDIYERTGSVTRLVSAGNLSTLGPAAPALTGTNPPSPAASTTPSVLGQAAPETWVKLYETTGCTGEPVAQGSSEALGGAGIPVAVAEASTTGFRATAEAEGLVSPCSPAITYRQEPPITPPPPGEEPPPSGGGGTPTPPGSGSGGTGHPGLTIPHGGGGGGGGSSGGGTGGVAYVKPQTLITFGPASKTRRRRILFRFSDATGQFGTSFRCKLDRHRWKSCSSPATVVKLSAGRHVFAVKGVNAVGTWDARPAKRSFRVVR